MIEAIEIEDMSENELIGVVNYAVQEASHCRTAIFDWLCVRAYTNYPDFTDSERALQHALEAVRYGHLRILHP